MKNRIRAVLADYLGHVDSSLFVDCRACGSRIPHGGINLESVLDAVDRLLSGEPSSLTGLASLDLSTRTLIVQAQMMAQFPSNRRLRALQSAVYVFEMEHEAERVENVSQMLVSLLKGGVGEKP